MLTRSLKFLLLAALCALAAPAAQARWPFFGKDPAETSDSLLKVDDAFQLMPIERKGNTLLISWYISKGYYLYRERIGFRLASPQAITPGRPRLPAGEKHDDPHFGIVHIYRGAGTYTAKLPLSRHQRGAHKIEIMYQGCAESGVCYPPQTKTFDVPPPPQKTLHHH